MDTSWDTGDGLVTDGHVNTLIQDAVTQFANDVGGFHEEAYAEISASFDTRDYFAIHVELVENGSEVTDEDVVITSTDRNNTTGDTVASDLQTAIRAMTGAAGTETVTWSSFKFTINWQQGNTATGDYIKVSAPTTATYADARELIGISGTYTGSTTTVGGFPEDCTAEYTIPTDAHVIERVEWDQTELLPISKEAAMSPQGVGTPTHYHVRGRTLHFIPSPSTQGICKVWYRGQPTDIDFDSDASLPSAIPSQYHKAIPFLAAYYLCLEQADDKLGQMRYANYAKIMKKFRIARKANDTAMDDGTSYKPRFRVTL